MLETMTEVREEGERVGKQASVSNSSYSPSFGFWDTRKVVLGMKKDSRVVERPRLVGGDSTATWEWTAAF